MSRERIKVGILLFNEIEVLDFAGPFEVFSLATGVDNEKLCDVLTIGETGEMISARNGLKVVPDLKFSDTYALIFLLFQAAMEQKKLRSRT